MTTTTKKKKEEEKKSKPTLSKVGYSPIPTHSTTWIDCCLSVDAYRMQVVLMN